MNRRVCNGEDVIANDIMHFLRRGSEWFGLEIGFVGREVVQAVVVKWGIRRKEGRVEIEGRFKGSRLRSKGDRWLSIERGVIIVFNV